MAQLIECPGCGKSVSSDAKNCPGCGRTSPKNRLECHSCGSIIYRDSQAYIPISSERPLWDTNNYVFFGKITDNARYKELGIIEIAYCNSCYNNLLSMESSPQSYQFQCPLCNHQSIAYTVSPIYKVKSREEIPFNNTKLINQVCPKCGHNFQREEINNGFHCCLCKKSANLSKMKAIYFKDDRRGLYSAVDRTGIYFIHDNYCFNERFKKKINAKLQSAPSYSQLSKDMLILDYVINISQVRNKNTLAFVLPLLFIVLSYFIFYSWLGWVGLSAILSLLIGGAIWVICMAVFYVE